MKHDSLTRPVYSSETGRILEKKAAKAGPAAPTDGTVRLQRQTKGRGGGTVIVISGVPLPEAELKELAGALKKKCGCGGTVKDNVIEIQGDHRDIISRELSARGFKVKLSGG